MHLIGAEGEAMVEEGETRTRQAAAEIGVLRSNTGEWEEGKVRGGGGGKGRENEREERRRGGGRKKGRGGGRVEKTIKETG